VERYSHNESTPVGIYLRLRDRFRDTILLESTDHHAAGQQLLLICINAIGGIEITDTRSIEFKLPGRPTRKSSRKKYQRSTQPAMGVYAALRSATHR